MSEFIAMKRTIINSRCRALRNSKQQAENLMNRVCELIVIINDALGLRFGLENAGPLPSLMEELQTIAPCREENLHRVLALLEDQCRLRLGSLLNKMGRPLHELQKQVNKIDLDPIQDPVEDEDAPAEIMSDDVLNFVINSLDSRLITLHEHRIGFKEKIEKVGDTVAKDRAEINEDIGFATRNNMISSTKEEFITLGENHIRELLNDREVHDLEMSAELIGLLIPGALPFIGKPIFDMLGMLDECIRSAKIPTIEEEYTELGQSHGA